MGDVEDAGEVDGDDVFPILDHRLGRAQHAVAPRDAGIVDQDRDLADLFGDAFGDLDAVLAFCYVQHKAFGLSACLADLLRRRRRCCFIKVEQRHLRALPRIAERDRAADARARAGDDRDVAFEQRHGRFLGV